MTKARVPTRLHTQVAASVGAAPSLAPHLGELMGRLPSLGSPTTFITRHLAPRTTPRTTVLDIACGTGALAIALATHTGCRVHAIDASQAFIAEARRRAKGLPRVRFSIADVNDTDAWHDRFNAGRVDIAMMIGLWPLARAAPRLRTLVPPGGLYVLDDAIRTGRRFPDAPTMPQARAIITSLGDRILTARLIPRDIIARQAARTTTHLEDRAARLEEQHPKLKQALINCLDHHHEAARLLLGPLRPALWIIQRGDRS